MRASSKDPDAYKADNAAGVGVSGAEFLIESGATVVGNDTLTFEVHPADRISAGDAGLPGVPVHMLLIADNLEELANAKAYEFLLVVPPLKTRGGTGSALRSFALVP